MIKERIDCIIKLCEKDILNFPEIERIDFIDIFPTNIEDKQKLDDEAMKSGLVLEESNRGNFYYFINPFETKFGNISIIKIRKYDEIRVGAPDLVAKDFNNFKERYENAKSCKYVSAPTYNAIEIKTKNILACVMDIPTSSYYAKLIKNFKL